MYIPILPIIFCISGFISIRYCHIQVYGKHPTSTNGLHDDLSNLTRWFRNACWHSKAYTGMSLSFSSSTYDKLIINPYVNVP